MHQLRSWIVWLLILSVSVFSIQVVFAQSRKVWTVLVYQVGDNDLESAMIKDFNEMERVGTTDQINVAVQLDRSPRFDTSNGNWTTTRRYLITRDPDEQFPPNFSTFPNDTIQSQLIADLGKKNMGDEETLKDFLLWGIRSFPADRYFVILSDHGAGVRPFRLKMMLPSRGMMFTDSFNDYIDEDEAKRAFSSAVQELGRPIDIIGLDASEMSELEIAYQLKDACKYLIASQLSEPNDGYPYDRFLWELYQNPNISIEEFLSRFIQHYIESYRQGQPSNGAGSAVTNTVYNQAIVASYVQKLDTLAEVLISKINQFGGSFVRLRRQTQTFSETIYRDIYHYCQLIAQNINDDDVRQVAQSVMDLHGPGQDKALLYEGHANGIDHNVNNAHGISIYFPDPSQFDERYLRANDFAKTTKWGQFLQQLGRDTIPPKVTVVFPISGQSIPIVRPALLLKVEDEGSSGIGSDAVQQILLDGQSLTNFSFDSTTGRLLVIASQPLSEGNHILTVTVSDLIGNIATREISFSISPIILLRGIRTFSVPMGLSIGDSRQVLRSQEVKTARWLSDERRWTIYPDDIGGSLLPPNNNVTMPPAGLGYFVRLPEDIAFTSDGTPLEPDRSYAIPLQKGWNLFANPYPADVDWNNVRIQVGSNTFNLSQAINAGYILSPPIAYEPDSSDPFRFGRYMALAGRNVWLKPFSAYWVKGGVNGKLIMPTPLQQESRERINFPTKSWAVRLEVLSGEGGKGFVSSVLEFGVSPSARQGRDILDVPLPPDLFPSTRAYFVAENWHKRLPEPLIYDFRPEGERIFWDFVVEATDKKQKEVLLTWKGLSELPLTVRVWLLDKATGQIISLRSTNSYRFQIAELQRSFRLIAQVGSSPLRIVGLRSLRLRGNQGIAVEGRLTLPSAVTTTIKSLTGRTVKVLVSDKLMPAGRVQFQWDGRSNDGKLLPKGIYICELTARDELGVQVRANILIFLH